MLHPASKTVADWLLRVQAHLDEVRLDPAHCEKKAAAGDHEIDLERAAKLTDRDAFEARLSALAQAQSEIFSEPCDRVRLHAG